MGAAFPPARMGEGRNYVPKPTPELSRRGHTLRWMTRIEHHATRRSVRWPALLVLGALGLGVLIVLGPLLMLAALILLAVAWRLPHRVAPHLRHPRLARVPQWLRASPLRFATALFVLTLPLAATSYTVGGDAGGPADAAATTATPTAQAVADSATASPTPAPTLTPQATPTARPTARTTPSPTVAATPTPQPTPEPTVTVGAELNVYFLDVGQGDATLFVAPDATLLIDTGRHDRNDVVPHLRSLGVTSIDVVAITHAHADHIGQLDRVLGSFSVGEVWMSGTPHTTLTFDRAITALERSDANYEEPRAGDTTTVGSLVVEILNPVRLSGDIDADTLAMRVSYGSVSFLFTGDMEASHEAAMVARAGGSLPSTVYQVGHHGSGTSTSAALLAAVRPEVAIYSASATNQYGHPHAEVIHRLNSAGIDVYGTAIHGTVTVITDGSSYRIETGQAASPIAPVAPTPATPAPTSAPAPPPASGCQPGQVDINSAGFEQLQLIIHIGPDRAQQILDLRPFSSVDAMDRISGIGPARLADIKAEGVACVP